MRIAIQTYKVLKTAWHHTVPVVRMKEKRVEKGFYIGWAFNMFL